jgi:hypothetical protein
MEIQKPSRRRRYHSEEFKKAVIEACCEPSVNGGLKLTQFSHLQRLKTDTPQILCRIGVLEGGPKAQPERCLCGAALTQ